MALNKYMHPRNIYRTPPNFEKLSKQYEEFGKIITANMDATGKPTINYKDPDALRVLTKCLLKADFNLDVDIPKDRLVPTLPLRLNYILWLEDLMNAIKRTTEVRGIDIGTGAVAIYPLLAAVKNNKWHMLGTESDAVSFQKAQENVNRNNLQGLIQLKYNEEPTLIQHLFSDDNETTYDFCMCNPPFYSNIQELYESRSPARLPPKNGFTGSPQELITEGGELEFCRKLIKESINCKDKVLIFTTMIGHKYHLSLLLQDLKAQNIKHTHTEFCQGRVTRWGLAWTFQDYDIYKLLPPRDKSRKKIVPMVFQLTETPGCEYNLDAVFNKIKKLLNSLDIEPNIICKRGHMICLDMIARVNTWSNQRKRRRLMQRACTKKIKFENGESSITNIESSDKSEENGESAHKSGENRESSIKGEENRENSVSLSSENEENFNQSGANMESFNKSGENSNKRGVNEESSNQSGETGESSNQSGENEEISNKLGENEGSSYIGGENRAETETNEKNLKNETCSYKNTDKAGCSTKNTHLSETFDYYKVNSSNILVLQTRSLEGTGQVAEKDPLVHAFLKLLKRKEAIFLEMECVGGSGGKESLHQIMQFIKNNWK